MYVQWLRRGIEAGWLSAILLVPLTSAPLDSMFLSFQTPKVAVLRALTGFIAVLWASELILSWRSTSPTDAWWGAAKGWISANPARIVLLVAALFLLVNVLSTMWSLSIATSLWGKTPGADGYSLYNMAAYFLLFAAVATHLKSTVQLRRLLGAVVVTGIVASSYGIYQWAFDPDSLAHGRVISSLGNPIFFGALLVLTIPITLSIALSKANSQSWALWLPAWSFALVLQLFALILTMSRGPWVGTAIALGVFPILTVYGFRAWRARGALRAALLGATVLFIALTGVGWALGDAGGSVTATAVVERGKSLLNVMETGKGVTRTQLWSGGVALATDRPSFAFGDDQLSFSRSVVGYGPEMFGYLFPLKSPPELPSTLSFFYTYAHNHVIHEWVELGFLGLVAYLGLIGASFVAALRLLRLSSQRLPSEHQWVLIGIMAAIVGRFIEEISGIARVSDSTVFWVLLAILVALPALHESRAMQATERRPKRASTRQRRQEKSAEQGPEPWRLGLVIVLALTVGWFTWDKNVNYVHASIVGADSVHAMEAGDGNEALALIERAIGLAPDVKEYHLHKGAILDLARDGTIAEDAKNQLAIKALEANQAALDVDPLSARTVLATANSAMELARLGDAKYTPLALGLYERLQALRPDTFEAHNILASAYFQVGDPERALIEVDRSLEMTGHSGEAVDAYLTQGAVYLYLSAFEKSRMSAEAALELAQPDSFIAYAARELLIDAGEGLKEREAAETQ